MAPQINQIFKPLIMLWLFLFACHLSPVTCQAQEVKYIRVAVEQNANSLSLKVRGPYELIDSGTKKTIASGNNLKTTVAAYKNSTLLGKVRSSAQKIFVKTAPNEPVIINGRLFKGNVELVRKSNSKLTAVNHIELEDYVKGILYHEVSHYWPEEALKAQAIACRTYALNQARENKSKDFDVTNDTLSQVYGGFLSERYRTNAAVEATKGKVLTFRGEVFPAYFHATCGGHTEDASNLWNINIAPLKGRSCSFCAESPHFNWHYDLSLKEMEEKLQESGFKAKNIKDIKILGLNDSGRVTYLDIKGEKKDLKISGKDFRLALGPVVLRSTNFSVQVIKNDAVFQGHGWGHGVGMCQWGAYFMAKQGIKAEEILIFYYPGTDVKVI